MSSVLNTDSFDRRRFGQLYETSKKMKEVEKKGRQQLPSFRPLMGDMWAGLFKMKPELQEEVAPESQINHQFMQRIMNDEAYERFREFSRLDDLTSAVGCMRYSETVLNWIEEQTSRNKALSKALKEAMSGDAQRMQQASEAMSDALDQNGSALSKGLQKAGEETVQTKENLKSLFGGIQPGSGEAELKKIPLRDQFALAEQLSGDHKLKEIAKWAGRLKLVAQQKQRNKHRDSIDRSGVTMGNQVEKLLPAELAAFSSPITRNDFLRRFAEGQTLQFDTRGKETLGKGPIVLCLDQSGSMSDQDAMSKGFVLALMSIARKQRRDFSLILFSGRAETPRIFKQGKISVKDMVDLATVFMGGGTDFGEPLRGAADVISKSRFKKADIIFVTDGEAHLPDQFIAHWTDLKKQKEFRVLSLLLGTEQVGTVSQFSDRVIKASDFSDSAVHQAFEI